MKNLIDPGLAREYESLSRNNGCADDRVGVNQCCCQIATANVFGQRFSDVAMYCSVEFLIVRANYMNQPCPGPIMLIANGIDINVLERDAMNAMFFALAISSALASTMPRIFF